MMKKSNNFSEVSKKKKVSKKLIHKSSDEKEESAVLDVLNRISINARRRAQSKKTAVTIIRDGKIVRIKPNKVEQVIGEVKKTNVRIDIKKIKRLK